MVDLEAGEQLDAAAEHIEARHAPATDVEVVAAAGEDRRIGHAQAGQLYAGLRHDLAQGLQRIKKAGGIGRGNPQTGGRDGQLVGFRRAGCGFEAHVRLGFAAANAVQAGEQLVQDAADAGIALHRNAHAGCGGQDKAPSRVLNNRGRGQQVQHGSTFPRCGKSRPRGMNYFSTVWKNMG